MLTLFCSSIEEGLKDLGLELIAEERREMDIWATDQDWLAVS